MNSKLTSLLLRVSSGILLVLLVLNFPEVSAQDSEANHVSKLDAAKDAFMRGVSHMRARQFEEASVAFEESLHYQKRASTLCNLAKAYDQRGDQEAKALAYYKQCAAHPEAERFRDHAKARAYAIEQARIERRLALQRGKHEAPAPGPVTSDSDSATFVWIGMGSVVVGGGLLLASILVAGDASSTIEELEERYPNREIPEQLESGAQNPDVERLRSAEDQITLSTGLVIGGAVVATAGLGFLLASLISSAPEDHAQQARGTMSTSAPRVAAIADHRTVMIAVRGAF